jgi:hypothetical protein
VFTGPTTFERALAAIEVLVLVGPVAVYVLWLGLVNSRPTPRLIRLREDFLTLTVAIVPFVAAPMVRLVRAGQGEFAVLFAALVLVCFLRLLPHRQAGWVIYNVVPGGVERLTDAAVRSLGWVSSWDGRRLRIPDRGLVLELRSLPALRNVTLHLRSCEPGPSDRDIEQLRAELGRLLGREAGLPSVVGACLCLAGVTLLIVPLGMLSRHSDAIAEVVTRVLPS